jgi:drug/metabolite transporter (DMT)-like permease
VSEPSRRRTPGREPVAVEDQIRRLHLERFSREDWVLAILGVVLILDLLVLPWFSFGATINVGSATVSIGGSLTAVDAPDAWLGVLALLSCAFLVADLGFERLSPETRVPSIASDRKTTRYILACVAAGLIALKFLFHIGRFGELALGFWLAVLLVGALVMLTRRSREVRPAPSSTVEPAPEPGSSA